MLNGRFVRNVANMVNGSTPLGVVLGIAARGRFRMRSQLIIVDQATLPFVTASAMTVGSVVLIPRRTLEDVSRRIPTLIEHEDAHAWQWSYCLGLPFLPLYLATTFWSLARTKDRAHANFFEVQAGLESGGYVKR